MAVRKPTEHARRSIIYDAVLLWCSFNPTLCFGHIYAPRNSTKRTTTVHACVRLTAVSACMYAQPGHAVRRRPRRVQAPRPTGQRAQRQVGAPTGQLASGYVCEGLMRVCVGLGRFDERGVCAVQGLDTRL